MKVKMIVLSAALLMTAFGASGIANAGGHWVCKPGGGQGLSRDGCWYKDDSIEYRGKSDAKPVEEILKDVKAKAEKEAAALSGKALADASANASIAAEIAAVKAGVFTARMKKLIEADEKSGIKTRGNNPYAFYYPVLDLSNTVCRTCSNGPSRPRSDDGDRSAASK